MPWWAILCAGIFGALVLPASLAVFVATIRVLRGLAALVRVLETRALTLEESARRLEQLGAAAAASQAAAAQRIAELNASLARLRVLTGGLAEAHGLVAVIRVLRALR
jgi:hypothetical protein